MDPIDDFLSGKLYAVAGASNDPDKYGNRVLKAYRRAGLEVIPVNPRETEVDGLPCVNRIADLPAGVHGLSIVTPPQVGKTLVEEAAAHGIKRVWFQPGAESAEALARARELGIQAIADGACVMVALARRTGAQ